MIEGLVNTTPSLKAALDIGIAAVQYDAEGQFASALERYESALQQIIQLLGKEPKGRRKELLHQQVSNPFIIIPVLGYLSELVKIIILINNISNKGLNLDESS